MFGDGEPKWGKWGPYRKQFFPDFTPKRIERYMKMGRFVDLEKYKGLASIPQRDILQLIGLGGDASVGKFLAKHKIKVNKKPEDREAISQLRTQVKKVISRYEGKQIPIEKQKIR